MPPEFAELLGPGGIFFAAVIWVLVTLGVIKPRRGNGATAPPASSPEIITALALLAQSTEDLSRRLREHSREDLEAHTQLAGALSLLTQSTAEARRDISRLPGQIARGV